MNNTAKFNSTRISVPSMIIRGAMGKYLRDFSEDASFVIYDLENEEFYNCGQELANTTYTYALTGLLQFFPQSDVKNMVVFQVIDDKYDYDNPVIVGRDLMNEVIDDIMGGYITDDIVEQLSK
jgi:hypothetical protein